MALGKQRWGGRWGDEKLAMRIPQLRNKALEGTLARIYGPKGIRSAFKSLKQTEMAYRLENMTKMARRATVEGFDENDGNPGVYPEANKVLLLVITSWN